ncbi:MAG TPA: hypothetical protein ENH35_03565 [Candidatus Moranbacteria bacterium]|nr:hypothetical protein [Candidatus Moranbacteria bacterium]
MNIKQDVEGLYTERTQFSERLYELMGSIQYRLNAVDWHLRNLCQQHNYYEQKIAKNGLESSGWSEQYSLYYLFDDFIFNLISLYDYFGSYIYLSFVDQNKQKKMWSRLANAAGNQNNYFSNCILAKKIFKHHREWVIKLNDYRAQIIHYKLNHGHAKKRISISVKEGIQKTELMYSVPDDLVKLLNLQNCHKNETGFDLQFGAIEIAERSIVSLKELAQTALDRCTLNSIQFKEKLL